MEFIHDAHVEYLHKLEDSRDSFEQVISEHLRCSAVYWAFSASSILSADFDAVEAVAFVESCRNEDGGYGGNASQDSHLLYTLSAIQVLCLCDALDEEIDREKVAAYISGLQLPDGSFKGDEWGEVDTRFSYCALCGLAILGKLDAVDVAKAAEFVAECRNFDGGFGAVPGAESHAGQIFCCVGALKIAGKLEEHCDTELLGWWLSERQCDSGGLNGRPEKQADVCYSWWILSSLSMLGKVDWINTQKLERFILQCQDDEGGGISDRPNNVPDVFHTFFGIAGLDLLGYFGKRDDKDRYRSINPIYALPRDICSKLGLQEETGSAVREEGGAEPQGAAVAKTD